MRFFRKKADPTDEQRKRLARITNPNQKKALLAAIERGEVIPEYAWRPFPEGVENRPEFLALHESLVQHAAASNRDMMEVIASMAPESHIQYFADQARQTATPDSGFLCETPLPARGLAEAAEKLVPIAVWGIFNPYKPTFSFLTLLPVPARSECLLHFMLLNPFHAEERIYGLMPNQYADEDLDEILTEVIRRYATGDYALLSDCLPSFVLPLGLNGFFCQGLSHIGSADLRKACDRMQRKPNDPWGVASEEFRAGIASIVRDRKAERDRKADLRNADSNALDQPATPNELRAWLDVITKREHWGVYFGQMQNAWNGAIEHRPTTMTTVEWPLVEALIMKILSKDSGRK